MTSDAPSRRARMRSIFGGEVLGTVSGTASPSRDRGEAVAVDQVQELERRPGGRFSPRSHWLMSPLVTFR
jgi:hypothetical protein